MLLPATSKAVGDAERDSARVSRGSPAIFFRPAVLFTFAPVLLISPCKSVLWSETVSPAVDPIRSSAALALDATRFLYSRVIPVLEELDKRDGAIAARRRFATGCGGLGRMRAVPCGLVSDLRLSSRYTRYTRIEASAYIPAIRISTLGSARSPARPSIPRLRGSFFLADKSISLKNRRSPKKPFREFDFLTESANPPCPPPGFSRGEEGLTGCLETTPATRTCVRTNGARVTTGNDNSRRRTHTLPLRGKTGSQ